MYFKSGFEKILTAKRYGDEITRSTNDELTTTKVVGETIAYYFTSLNKRQCKGGEENIESLPSGSGTTCGGGLGNSSGSDPDVQKCLGLEAVSKLAQSAVLIFLLDGDINVFACSGIPVERNSSYIRVLTSANLATALKDKRKPGSSMKIRVRDVSNNIACGWMEEHDLDHGIAFVKVTQFLDVCVVNLHHGLELLPHSNLVAIQLIDSGAMPVRGILNKDSSASEDGKNGKVLCKISKAGDGGPPFDGDGNFVGMNLFSDTGRCAFVQRSVIIEQLEQFEKRYKLRAQRELDRFRPVVICIGERQRRKEDYVLI